MKAKSVQDHLIQANAHMTKAKNLALQAQLKREIAQRQEMLRRLQHLDQLHGKGGLS